MATLASSFMVMELIVVALIIQQGLVFLEKKKIKAERRREEIKRLVRLWKSEAPIVESERQRITDVACSVCDYAPTTKRCSRCKVPRYCSRNCQKIHWRQGHRDECVETKGNHCQQAETNYEEDEPRTDKQPSMPEAITNNSSNSISFTLEDFLGFATGYDAEEENTNPNRLIESCEDATKKALEQSEERVRLLEEELAKSKKEVSLLKSECSNWSARTSFVSRRLDSLMRESDENQRALEQERKRRLQLEQDDGLQIAKRKAERLRKDLANTRKSVEYAESGRVKALRELEKERKLMRLLKMECEELRQSSMRQMEKKEQELAIALNAAAAAEAKLFDLEREVNSLDDKACAICITNEKDVAFGCGHMACWDCMLAISKCHICRKPITSRLRLFPG